MINNYLEAPNARTPDMPPLSIFLGGGISGCQDWQTLVSTTIRAATNLLVVNPRRSNFDITDSSSSIQQIIWEFQELRAVSCRSFWFPKESICPITLFEYGYWLAQSKQLGMKIFVGADPEYARVLDLQVQTHLVDPNIKLHDTLESMCAEIIEYAHALELAIPSRSKADIIAAPIDPKIFELYSDQAVKQARRSEQLKQIEQELENGIFPGAARANR
jgi:hypothetical protein